MLLNAFQMLVEQLTAAGSNKVLLVRIKVVCEFRRTETLTLPGTKVTLWTYFIVKLNKKCCVFVCHTLYISKHFGLLLLCCCFVGRLLTRPVYRNSSSRLSLRTYPRSFAQWVRALFTFRRHFIWVKAAGSNGKVLSKTHKKRKGYFRNTNKQAYIRTHNWLI